MYGGLYGDLYDAFLSLADSVATKIFFFIQEMEEFGDTDYEFEATVMDVLRELRECFKRIKSCLGTGQ